MSEAVFKINNLTCCFGESVVLNAVSLKIEAGECVALIGPNGSGKSTLLNCIGGFVDCSGEVSWRGQQLSRLKPAQRAQLGIGRVFQSPGIFRSMSVLDNLRVAFEAQHKRLNKTPNFAELLRRVGLDGFAQRPAGILSGGQLRLLEIVRLICVESELLLLDEPTAGVSPKLKLEVIKLLRDLKALGKTILLVEHDMNFVSELCQRVIVLAEGQVFFDGSVSAAKSSQAVQELYFGTGGG